MARKIIHYASYESNGTETFGTAELVNGSGWLFRADGEHNATLVDYRNVDLMLYGLADVADMQHDIDMAVGGASAIACSRLQEVR